MRKPIATFIVFLGCVLGVSAQGNNEWIKYTSTEGRYSVSVPQEPKVSNHETVASTGEKVPQYLASSPDGNGILMVGYFDIGEMTFSFDKARDGMLTAMSATLMGEETISLGSSPGRSLKLLAKASDVQEFIDRVRFFEVGKRVYVLQCIFPKLEESPAIVEKCAKFFDSFKLEAH
jgi:hypothetical protein